MSKYTIRVVLFEQVEAEDENEAYDEMMDLIADRGGMEISSHEIIKDED